MALACLIDVFEQSVQGTTAITSSSKTAEQLGTADQLVIQFHVTQVTGTSPTISATYYHSNDGENFVSHTVLLTNQTLSSPPYDDMKAVVSSTVPLGRYGRLTVQLGGTSPAAYVRVIICGRTN